MENNENIQQPQVEANENVETVVTPEAPTTQAVQPTEDANYNAKLIREATTNNLLNKLGVSSLDDAKALITQAEELKQANLSQEERVQRQLAEQEAKLKENEAINQRLIRERELLSLGVQPAQLEDFVKLTNGLEGEALEEKVNFYAKPQPTVLPVVNTAVVSTKAEPVPTQSLADRYKAITAGLK